MVSDVIIIGAGIIGAALAEALSARGLKVQVLEAGTPGAGTSAAGMGHLVVLDDNPAELALSRDGVERWRSRLPELPFSVEYRASGTIWVARDAEEMAEVERKHAAYAALGLDSQRLDAAALYRYEPNLAAGLAGGLRMPEDGVLYPPAAVAWLLARAETQGTVIERGARVVQLDEGRVVLADGRERRAPVVVIAAGNASVALLPQLPLKPRKGQLVITERYPGFLHHQLVELAYIKNAHASDADSVSFNLQPRATGQILIGSSRQYQDESLALNWPLLQRMLDAAFTYMPGLRELTALRAWTGFRPASPDKLPLLGPLPGRPDLWLATGHEGLGITTALSSAALLADRLLGVRPVLDPTPYDPSRFAELRQSEPELRHG